jgi:hypothetical protein
MKTLYPNINPVKHRKLAMLGVDLSSANFWIAVNYHNLFGNWNCVIRRMERLGLSDARNLFQVAYDVNKIKKGLIS